MDHADYDLCVIGGGINGVGIARDAAGRGLSVLLVEAADLGGATSSASTKLIHGGLRYLEYFEFDLVRHALREREVLLRLAPHIIWPMDFVLPHTPEQRPAWMIRLGLFLYDHLARRRVLKGSKMLRLAGGVLKSEFDVAFQYSDCWADDARLVVLNAMDAAEKGAEILTHTRCTGLREVDGAWRVSLDGRADISARMVVNAAGPWVSEFLHEAGVVDHAAPIARLVKGSHIITKRLYEGDEAYILQQNDGRICFVIPYEGGYTLIGTTEEEYGGDPRDARISDVEIEYLIAAYNAAFAAPIERRDVLWSYSGVRPLFDDGKDATGSATGASRDYKLHRHDGFAAPLMSVFGGKLTTYRVLAEDVMNRLLHLGNDYAAPWTADAALPGGDIPEVDFDAFLMQQIAKYGWMHEGLVRRYARAYGTRMDVFLAGAASVKDLGQYFGDDVYQAEIDYMLQYEFARDAEDIFWRRSKLGLHVGEAVIAKVEDYLDAIGD
ncbi:MAG: glycerol-3-phosphate dehydrogenase [Alphaproteobacteria bacterium]